MNIYRPETIHLALGDAFYDPVEAAEFPAHTLRYRNQRWAGRVGLERMSDADWIAHFGRFQPLPDNLPQPLALRYNGHQFRSWNPNLGDGRGFLFAQLRDDQDRLLDLGTKGSGQTPWSRRGDGRLTLKGGMREILATEMLEALGVDTSKSFSLIETGEALQRHDEPSPTRSSVLVRLSHSHIRIGSFQRLLAQNDAVGMERLLRHVVKHYAPDAIGDALPDLAAAFLDCVKQKTARTTARWMAAGFVHGVLNTDNINITGESFDYGPWRFLPHYDPGFTAAYFDENGLYAFGRQPETISWNLARLAECLLLLAPRDTLEAALSDFGDVFWREMRIAFPRRLGLKPRGDEADQALIRTLFSFLNETQMPFEGAMFDLFGGHSRLEKARSGPRGAFYDHPLFAAVEGAMTGYLPAHASQLDHPYFQRPDPITLVYEVVEALWEPIAARDDWAPFYRHLTEIEQLREAYGLAQ